MPYRGVVRSSRVPLFMALFALVWLSAAHPAQAHRSHEKDARIGAQRVVLKRAAQLDNQDPRGAADRVATGDVGKCRRLSGHAYECAASYDVRTHSLTERTEHRTCTETVRVRVSHRALARTRARVLRDFVCRDTTPPRQQPSDA